jgi:arylsulfatase A-like enzyme
LLTGGSIKERPLIWHYPHYGNQGGEPSSIIRDGDWKLIHYYEDGREELYNLKADLEEAKDIAPQNQELVRQLSEKLFTYLHEVGARFPEKDPQYNEELEKKHLERVVNERLPQLEKQRLNFLSKDYDPGNNWWGSKITKE